MRKTDYMETKQHATKNTRVNQEIKRKIKKYLETNNNENTTIQNLWDAQKQCLEGSSQQHRPSS